MPGTEALEVAPGLVQLTRTDTGVQLWLAVRPDGEARYFYGAEAARGWYADRA